jgi:hypothetical protein
MSRFSLRHAAPAPPAGFRRFLLETATEAGVMNLTAAIERDRIVSLVTRDRPGLPSFQTTALGGRRLIAPEPRYEIERIVDFYMAPTGEVFAHVEWHGYPMADSTFEPMSSFDGEALEVEMFHYLDREVQRRALALLQPEYDDEATESMVSYLDESQIEDFTVAGEHLGKCFGHSEPLMLIAVSQ